MDYILLNNKVKIPQLGIGGFAQGTANGLKTYPQN